MDALGVIAQVPLQDADAIHHHIDAGETWRPMRRRHVGVEIASDPLDGGIDAARKLEVAAAADHGRSLAPKRRGDLAADEAVGPGHETLHVSRGPPASIRHARP
jgi:hypothetical protein